MLELMDRLGQLELMDRLGLMDMLGLMQEHRMPVLNR